MIRFLIISLFLFSCGESVSNVTGGDNYQTQITTSKSDSLLLGIEKKIENAFVQGVISNNADALVGLDKKLESLQKEKKQNLIVYWQSYLKFYSSIFYLKINDKDQAEQSVDEAIDIMDDMERKNSEDYALLSMLQSFSLQFKGMKAMFIVGKIKKNANRALAIDSTNLRANYVLGSNDFYTPAKYGGGKVAESFLLKAIALPEQKIVNKYLPSWGKEEAFGLLIKLYAKKEKWDLAKKYFNVAMKHYPDSHQINALASGLVGK